jgi:hypothetical protein
MGSGRLSFRLYLTPVQAAVCVGRVLCEKPHDVADASGDQTLHASCCLGTAGVHRPQPGRVRHFNHETQPAHFQSILAPLSLLPQYSCTDRIRSTLRRSNSQTLACASAGNENAIAILNVGWMSDGVEQETYCGLKFPRFPESDFKIFRGSRSMMIG